jgi:hypothetical protein
MTDLSKWAAVITAVAAVISAVAWPVVASVFLLAQRKHVSNILLVLVRKLSKAKTIKAGGFEIAEEIIEEAFAGVPIEQDKKGSTVPEAQVNSARSLKKDLRSAGVGKTEATKSARDQVHNLALEYENIRNSMPSGPKRTSEMNKLMAKMRTLAFLTKPLIPRLTQSTIAGEKLAAIAALQIEPDVKYSRWLAERVAVEHPFVFFNAAVALRQLVLDGDDSDKSQLKADLQYALQTLKSYTQGPIDTNSVEVLQDALGLLETSS